MPTMLDGFREPRQSCSQDAKSSVQPQLSKLGYKLLVQKGLIPGTSRIKIKSARESGPSRACFPLRSGTKHKVWVRD